MNSPLRTATLGVVTAAVALAFPATTSAAPREWDIGSYDQCIIDGLGKGYDDEEWTNHKALCCWASGGDWNIAKGECQAPPAEQQAQHPLTVNQGNAPVYNFDPSTPPATRIPSRVINQSIGAAS